MSSVSPWGPAYPVTGILPVSGSMRRGSTNTAVLNTAQAVAPGNASAVLYDGLAELPAFNPDDDHDPLPATVANLRQQIAAAGAVLFCTPEYAGALPGSFKNLLDWTVGGGEIYGKPVAWINASLVAAPTGGAAAHTSLATVLGYVGADIVDAACERMPMTRAAVGPDGLGHRPGAARTDRHGPPDASPVHALQDHPDLIGWPARPAGRRATGPVARCSPTRRGSPRVPSRPECRPHLGSGGVCDAP